MLELHEGIGIKQKKAAMTHNKAAQQFHLQKKGK